MERGEVRLKQTASQIWCLLRLIPFMIGHYFLSDDQYWNVYLLLRDIVEELLRPTYTVALTYVLEDMIREHHERYLEVFVCRLVFFMQCYMLALFL